jgi:hypothetical protein
VYPKTGIGLNNQIVEMGGCRPAPRGASSACFPTSRTLPVYCFVDCDPYGFTNIYRTLKVGSGNAAHINRFLCVPRARFLGVGKVRRRRDDLQRGIGRLSLEFPHVPNVRELANCPVNSVVRNPH